MKQEYNNPLVTYDEIIEAIQSILECSLSGNYLDSYDYLNIKYESPSKIDQEKEKLLANAIDSLRKSIDTTSKIVRRGLEKDIKSVDENIFKIETEYLLGQEKRKLAAQPSFISKLKEASLGIESLYNNPLVENNNENKYDGVDTNSVFSDFEKKVISDFPVFFKEEISLAQDNNEDAQEINNIMSHNFVDTEELVEDKKNDKLEIIEKAILKARELGDQNIIQSLEKKYEEELKSDGER